MNFTKAFSYLIAANFEAVALLGGAWFGADWLNRNVPQTFDWVAVTFPVAGLVILHSWYVIFRVLLKMDSDAKMNKKT